MTLANDNNAKGDCYLSEKLRPNANNGYWLIALLPAAIIHCHIKYPQNAFYKYKLCSVISIGMLFTSIFLVYQAKKSKEIAFNVLYTSLTALICTMVFAMGHGFLFSLYSGIISCPILYVAFNKILKHFPLSFTLGEAILVCQSAIFFVFLAFYGFFEAFQAKFTSKMNASTLIIQIGLLGIAAACYLGCKYKTFQNATGFYTMFAFCCIFLILIPLHVLLGQSALVFIVNWIIEDVNMIKYMFYVVLCSTCAVFAVRKQIVEARKASTRSRKIFHILAVIVFLPGLLYQCSFLYLASAVTLGIFVFLELLRFLNMPPLGESLQDGFSVFCDEKDSGKVALTPIYLLISVSLPLFLHPTPCDMTDSAGFNLLPLLSGVLSIGIGDTFASLVGKTFGRFRWPNTKKTVEGTFGYILSQFLFLYALTQLGFLRYTYQMSVKVGIAVISTSLIEAFTSQVDNLALPLLMFTLLL